MGAVTDEPVVIEARYNGPPGSGHGGWSAGQAAIRLAAPVVEVTLHRPPPLDTPLRVVREPDAVSLLRSGDVIVAARGLPGVLVESPAPPSLAEATEASARFAWYEDHPFPGCFGCGPERDPADALRLFCGPVGDGRFAVPWVPPSWTGEEAVSPQFLWAALDCPSSAPVHGTIGAPVVLGRLTVGLEGPVAVGAPHVICSWLEREDGRKRHTGVALYTASGERRAVGRAIWFELARPPGT